MLLGLRASSLTHYALALPNWIIESTYVQFSTSATHFGKAMLADVNYFNEFTFLFFEKLYNFIKVI
jgi:hypothetical protein